MIILLKGVAMKKKIRNSIIVIFISTVFFALGCSSPKYDFYDSIRNQNIEGISKYYVKIDPIEQESSMKRGLSIACGKGDKKVLDALLSLGGRLDNCSYLTDSINENISLDSVIYVYRQAGLGTECLSKSMLKAMQLKVIRTDIMRFLVEEGADVNTATDRGITVLHHASEGRDLSLVKLLLSQNANVNAVDKHGVSPLHLAVYSGSDEIASLLLAEGADINSQTTVYKINMSVPKDNAYQAFFELHDMGESPLSLAIMKYIDSKGQEKERYFRNIETLLKKNPKLNTYIIKNKYQEVEFKGEGGVSLRFSQGHGGANKKFSKIYTDGTYTISEGAIWETGNEKAGTYFRVNADKEKAITISTNCVPLKNYYTEKTVSHLAAEKDETELLDLLKKHGADFSIKDSNGKTVMELMKQKQ